MDLTLVSSNHTKKVFEESKFEIKNKETNITERKVELAKPVEVLFEGADLNIYKTIESHLVKNINLDSIKEKFAYLFVGHWMQGDVGEDRKNVGLLIKAFYETFKNKSKKPALILKTSTVGSSYMDRDELTKRIKAIKETVKSNNLPNVYLLHGEFTDIEMNEIYNHSKVKAMVNLTKGEGFGRPLLEFSLTNKPIITTNWSGHTDYLNPEFVTLLPGTLTTVHPSAANTMLLAEAEWFSVDHGHVGHYLKDVFENYKGYAENAKRQGFQSRTKFSFEAMKEKLDKLFTSKIPDFPKQIQLKLPQLNKIELPKLKKIEA
jgi:glycosyltransferase involved in cell wall biosynthesis